MSLRQLSMETGCLPFDSNHLMSAGTRAGRSITWLYGALSSYSDIKSDILYGMALASQGPI